MWDCGMMVCDFACNCVIVYDGGMVVFRCDMCVTIFDL